MSILQTVTEQDLSKIREKVYKADRKQRTHHIRAKLIATFGHIGFCLGLFLTGFYVFYLGMVDSTHGEFAQWYDAVGQGIRSIMPEAWQNSGPEFVILAALPMIGSIGLAIVGKMISLFIFAKEADGQIGCQRDVDEARSMIESIESYQKYFKEVDWPDFYPSSGHKINLYNFIPWLSLLGALTIGVLSFDSNNPNVYFVFVIPVYFAIPIVLCWRLSAWINYIFYRSSSGKDMSVEKKQLEAFIAQCEREEQEEKKRIAKKKREEQLKQAEIIYQQAIANDPMNEAKLKKAADMGHPEACLRYGLVLLSNLDTSAQTNSEIRKINETAAKYFKTPAKQGNKEAEFYWLISRCQYESGNMDDWQDILSNLRRMKAGGHVPSHMQGVCDMAIENAVQCLNDLESRTYSSYSTSSYTPSSYTPSHSSYSHDKGLNTYMTERGTGQSVYYKDGQYVNENGVPVPINRIED